MSGASTKQSPQADPTTMIDVNIRKVNKSDWSYITAIARANRLTVAEMIAIFATALHDGTVADKLEKLRQARNDLLDRRKGEE